MHISATFYCPILYSKGQRTFLGITPKYICVQQYYPQDLKVGKNELTAFKIVAYARHVQRVDRGTIFGRSHRPIGKLHV
jgi:hypothetical protein